MRIKSMVTSQVKLLDSANSDSGCAERTIESLSESGKSEPASMKNRIEKGKLLGARTKIRSSELKDQKKLLTAAADPNSKYSESLESSNVTVEWQSVFEPKMRETERIKLLQANKSSGFKRQNCRRLKSD